MNINKTYIFKYEDRIIFKDDLYGFEDLILKNDNKFYNIYFEFFNIEESLKKVKNIILKNKNKVNFDYLYFYNAWDFINIVLEKSIYLPSNINLFVSTTCPIWCVYCNNPNDIHTYLSFKKIKNFLSHYNIWDNINFNILWQWDPIFNPDLSQILEYVKNKWAYITFFSWWKSLLFLPEEKFNKINSLVDEFKINISASDWKIYNKTHSNKVSEKEFDLLIERFRIIANKSTFIDIIIKENLGDLVNFIKFYNSLWAKNIEIKKDLHYPKNYILDNNFILNKIEKLLEKLINSNIWIVSNIWKWYINVKENEFDKRRETILDKYVSDILVNKKNNDIKIQWCYQFGNSLDITENEIISLCCHYKEWKVADLNISTKYYETLEFKEKYNKYIKKKNTPKSCEKCPMPIDRYKNYLKFNFVNKL